MGNLPFGLLSPAMKILELTHSLAAAHGGLPVVVVGLSRCLAASGTEVALVTADARNTAGLVEGANVAGSQEAAPIMARLRHAHALGPVSLVHQHGLWVRLCREGARFAHRLALPWVVSPHGMLEPWALGHHAWRKKIAWSVYQHRDLKRAAAFHVTSVEEGLSVRQLGFRQPIFLSPPGLNPIPGEALDPPSASAFRNRRSALFLSRLHPKKGLPLLLEAWHQLRPDGWELIIAGPDENGHREQLERLVRRWGLQGVVRFRGLLTGSERDTAFRRADLFVLPTHSENFGLVVAEALQYGVPVLTTIGAPWSSLVHQDCGWQVPVSVPGLTAGLASAFAMSDEERRAMGRRGKNWVEKQLNWATVGSAFADFYRWVLDGGAVPKNVFTDDFPET